MKKIMWWIFVTTLFVIGHHAYADYQAFLRRVVACSPGYFQPTREDLRRAMRYHGILFAQEDENHEWYFVRDGKRCRLFGYKKS